jgi:hypothetical protein
MMITGVIVRHGFALDQIVPKVLTDVMDENPRARVVHWAKKKQTNVVILA